MRLTIFISDNPEISDPLNAFYRITMRVDNNELKQANSDPSDGGIETALRIATEMALKEINPTTP